MSVWERFTVCATTRWGDEVHTYSVFKKRLHALAARKCLVYVRYRYNIAYAKQNRTEQNRVHTYNVEYILLFDFREWTWDSRENQHLFWAKKWQNHSKRQWCVCLNAVFRVISLIRYVFVMHSEIYSHASYTKIVLISIKRSRMAVRDEQLWKFLIINKNCRKMNAHDYCCMHVQRKRFSHIAKHSRTNNIPFKRNCVRVCPVAMPRWLHIAKSTVPTKNTYTIDGNNRTESEKLIWTWLLCTSVNWQKSHCRCSNNNHQRQS